MKGIMMRIMEMITENEKRSLSKQFHPNFTFKRYFFLNCSCRFLHHNYLFKLASLLLKFIKTENPLLANQKSILLEKIYSPIRINFSGSKKLFFLTIVAQNNLRNKILLSYFPVLMYNFLKKTLGSNIQHLCILQYLFYLLDKLKTKTKTKN